MRILLALTLLSLSLTPLAAVAADGCCPEACCCEEQESLEIVVFHLPLAFNDGSAVPQELLEDLLADVVEIAGGFTYYEATGGWMHEGRLYREPVWVVKVGLQEEQVEGFVELIEGRLKTELGQMAVWVEEEGEAEIR